MVGYFGFVPVRRAKERMATAMQVPLQIAFHNMEHSEAVKAVVEEKVARLERFYGRITGCRVVIEAPHRHHRQGNHYQVRIDLTVPGGEVVVNREPPQRSEHKDLHVALRDAFDAARRRLEDHARRQRQEVKTHEPAPHARVSQLNPLEGYGFLRTPDGREVYFHRHAVLGGDFEHLQVGDEVVFVEEAGDKGPQASTVRPVGRHNHD
jgi:ribosomal subunit interface protein